MNPQPEIPPSLAGAIDVRDPGAPKHPPDPSNVLRGPRRQIVIIFGILATLVISVLAITLLCFKWYQNEDYNAMILIWGPDEWAGATVYVTGTPNLREGTLAATLTKQNNMVIRFHVPPGKYAVRVRKGNRDLFEQRAPVELRERSLWKPFAPATQPVDKE